jgi:hypothetical protein
MAIRSKLTNRDPSSTADRTGAPPSSDRREPTEEEKAQRKERVAAAKDALARSVGLKGEQVGPARAALKSYLQRLNDPRQPDDAAFQALVEGPFRVPPKKKERRSF